MVSNEEDIEISLNQYRQQLEQVEEVLKHNTSEDLLQLKTDLLELINLTEESLLSSKKNNLLPLLENLETSSEHSNEAKGASNYSTTESSSLLEENDIIGTKCRVPFCHEWGEMSYHNAIILDVESSNGDEENEEQVRVVFCNPTHTSMLYCKHYTEGFCRYEDSTCRYSHGHVVSVSDLAPFEEPCYENVLVGEKCLAKDYGDLWYKATIVNIMEGDKVQVMFDSDDHLEFKELHDIHPLVNELDDSDEDDDDDNADEAYITNDHPVENEQNRITEFTIQTTEALGIWEKHTKGIGSKLMLKMGYVIGEGLGKNSNGRAMPVPIEILPQGKSLDKIMELRNNKQNAFKPKVKPKLKNKSSTKTVKNASIFDVINNKFRASKKSKLVHHISTEDLAKKSDKHISIQLMKTEEELKRSDHELFKLKDTLARSLQRRDEVTAKKIKEKIAKVQEYQDQLRTSEKFMNNQKRSRKAHKELISF